MPRLCRMIGDKMLCCQILASYANGSILTNNGSIKYIKKISTHGYHKSAFMSAR